MTKLCNRTTLVQEYDEVMRSILLVTYVWSIEFVAMPTAQTSPPVQIGNEVLMVLFLLSALILFLP